jgi:hypothetical protein
VKRAPVRVLPEIAALEGVQTVETRVVKSAILDIAGFKEPVVGQLVSIPDEGSQRLNLLALRSGRMPRAHSDDEALILTGAFNDVSISLLRGARPQGVIDGLDRYGGIGAIERADQLSTGS